MPTPSRRSSLAILVVLVAACSTPAVTVAPPATSSATAGTTTPVPSLPATPGPTSAGCSGIEDVDLAGIEVTFGSVDEDGSGGEIGFSLGPTYGQMHVIRVTDRSGQERCSIPPSPELPDQRGQILGGHEFITYPSTSGRFGSQAMLAARVTLTLDGGTAMDLPTRFIPGNENFDQVAITVPDVAGPGVLLLEFTWADTQFRYEATSTITVNVAPLSATEGCLLESTGYFEQVRDLLRHSVAVNSVPQVAFSPFNTSKFTPHVNEGIDAMVEYAFDPHAPSIIAAPGSALRVEAVSEELNLGDDMILRVWTRASVAKAVLNYPPEGTVLVLSRTPVKQEDGTFRLRVPHDPGRYVAGVALTFDSRCSSGTLWFIVNIDVVAP